MENVFKFVVKSEPEFDTMIELSDRFELSDTIHFHIKKWSINA